MSKQPLRKKYPSDISDEEVVELARFRGRFPAWDSSGGFENQSVSPFEVDR